MRDEQRGSKAQPGGNAVMAGTVPSMVWSGWLRSLRSVGTECNSPRV